MSEATYFCLSVLLGVLTAALLFWYAWLTRRISLAAIEQSEAPQKPCIVVSQIPDHSDDAKLEEMTASLPRSEGGIGPLTLKVRNIGSGPAVNIKFRLTGPDYWVDPMDGAPEIPPLEAGGEWDTGHPVMAMKDDERFVSEYESLGGKKYRSTATIEGRRFVRRFRFERI